MSRLRILVTVTLFLVAASAGRAEVVINEIMYHPASNLAGDEFLELHNTGGAPVSLDGWCFDGIQLCFGPGDSIEGGGFLVLASDAAQFLATYGFDADHTFLLQLDNNGERLALLDAALTVIDEVDFDDEPPWPVTPDGLGPSLELIDASADNATPRNWGACVAPAGQTAGAANSIVSTGMPPWVQNVQSTPSPAPVSPVEVTAEVLDATTVELFYRVGFEESEQSLSMTDDGVAPDAAAGDGVYTAAIPGQSAGTMLRFRIAASGPSGSGAYPRIDDTVTYDGTAVLDPVSSALPVIHWFIDPADYTNATCPNDPGCHLFTDETEPAFVYFNGRFYDGVQVRVRGQSSRTWPKKHWKFYLPHGHNFEAPGLLENDVDQFNLQSGYSDKTLMREVLAWETFRDAGAPYCQASHVRVEQNGDFYGLFVLLEDPDADWLRRNGLSQTAARYKAFENLAIRTLEQIIPEYEPQGDEDHLDLLEFILGINAVDPQVRRQYLLDNVDIPTTLNYIAAQAIVHGNDHIGKNYFVYRDTYGTGRWTMHAWDLDLTFGKNFDGTSVLSDVIWADEDQLDGYSTYVSPSHPLFGDRLHHKVDDVYNYFIDSMLYQADFRQMYYRRLRTLMDQLLVEGRYEDRLAQLEALIAPEAALDKAQAWGQPGQAQSLSEAVVILEYQYLDPRRVHLFETHSVCSEEIPAEQSPAPRVVIHEIMYFPAGSAEDEFIELYNPSTTEAVDLSGWRLDGVALNIPAGTVILPQQYVLLVKSDTQFRSTYGGGKFIAGEYDGSLRDTGEPLVLRNRFGAVVSSVHFESVAPWPAEAAGGGHSLELIDPSRSSSQVANWSASLSPGGTPGAANSVAGSLPSLPSLFVNEVLPVNVSINQDNAGEFDPWIELFNASSQPIDLDGLYLSDDVGVPTLWPIPAGTSIGAGDWLTIWADGDIGQGPVPPHASFSLSPTGGFVGLFAADGTLIDYLHYGEVPADHAFGRFPDGMAELSVLSIVTPGAANDAQLSPLILNEYNAVSPTKKLDNGNSDTYWGRVDGNGGDWFELAVTVDPLDVRGWQLVLTNDTGTPDETSQTLTLGSDLDLANLRAGTIITISEELDDDPSFDPQSDDWWMNFQAADGASGVYITAQDFTVSNDTWQLTIKDQAGTVVFGPAGEGVMPVSGVGNDEVFKLEEDPSPYLRPVANYNDGTSSTFGSPNIFSAGTQVQDFTALRLIGAQGTCTVPDDDGDEVCNQQDNCPDVSNADQLDADGDGTGDACDICPDDPYDDADLDGHCGDADNCPFATNTEQTDGDTDGVGDICDNCSSTSNSDQADDDGDAQGDACDACPGDALNDGDVDGVCHSADNCPDDANPGQENADGDAFGDACDPCAEDPLNDIDLDSYCVGIGFLPPKLGDQDNCPIWPNPSQADGDLDGVGDYCDNCPATANPSQSDFDLDGWGDDCDQDADGDGLDNASDNCPLTFNPDQADADGNNVGDACDNDADNDGIPEDGDGSGVAGDNFCPHKVKVGCDDNCPNTSNNGQDDSDDDRVGNPCDCKKDRHYVSQVPHQYGNRLRIAKTGTTATLVWTRAWQAFLTNVYRGTFAAGQAWEYDHVCFESNTAYLESVDPEIPAVGQGFYYLLSGRNECGEGFSGIDSSGQTILPFGACPSPGGDEDRDTDGDGDKDKKDNCPLVPDPDLVDSDDDFFGDVCDNCPFVYNPDQFDSDADGDGDACDMDTDADGLLDSEDNCPYAANPDQADWDHDGTGDLCDLCTDTDGDGLGDPGFPFNTCAEDEFPNDVENDIDGDGVSGVVDNCVEIPNSDQADGDGDGAGDACDPCPSDPDDDLDGDGLCACQCGAVAFGGDMSSGKESVLVGFGDSMRYLANATDPGLGLSWTLIGFDDSGWGVGTYGVGYEAIGGAEELLQTTVPVGTLSVYTRATFQIAELDDVLDLYLGADFDDAFVVWLNGAKVYTSPQMPAGDPQWDTDPTVHESSNGAEPDYGTLIDLTASMSLLVEAPAVNVLAVGVWNHQPFTPPSDDLVLVPRLSINRRPTMSYLANTDTDPGLGLSWIQPAFDDSSWVAGTFGVGYDTASGGIDALDLIDTPVPPGTRSVYVRSFFEVENVDVVDQVALAVEYDDGYVAWINGVEISRAPQMPSGDPDWDTPSAPHESSNGEEPDFDPALSVTGAALPALQTGVNVFAIGVWNDGPSSSDLVLWPSLSIASSVGDNCPTIPNPAQTDTDHDGVGDVCDNCPFEFNSQQTDSDGDGVGNACETP